MRTSTLSALGAAAVAACLGFPTASHAVSALPSETFNFTSDHCTGGCLTGQTSGGTVTVTESATNTLTFSITLLNGNQFINSGFQASFGFNLVGDPAITYSLINPAANYTIPNNGAPANPSTQTAGSLHMDCTGFFEYGLDGIGSGGSTPLGSTLSFTITGSGLTLASLEENNLNQLFAADIISGTSCTNGVCNTGGIDVSNGGHPVPIPGALGLLAPVLGAGFVGLRRRRKASAVAA